MLAGLQESPPVGLGTTFAGESVPGLRNDEGASCTRCDLKQAMTLSTNVVFNSLAKQVGGQAVADPRYSLERLCHWLVACSIASPVRAG